MSDRVFLDTNVVIYAYDTAHKKGDMAQRLLSARPVISVQVINEAVNVARRKLGLTPEDARALGARLIGFCEVLPLGVEDVLAAFDIGRRFQLSHWDGLIIAAAVRGGCTIIFSEDLHTGLQIAPNCRIVNPFTAA